MRLTAVEAMRLAIKEGAKGAGFVAPNPLVGCVILDREFNFLTQGHHARLGEAHAEVAALHGVKDPARLNGAHVFVTLEPCAHEGRTPSCAKALAKLPIASVTYGRSDPNPLVSGQGAEILRQAGKAVTEFAQLRDEIEELCEVFLINMNLHRPFVALKVAASLDGKIALANGESQWITGERAREQVQYLRGASDAVLIGAGTFLHDNPRLNSRLEQFASKPQKVVLLDPKGRCNLQNSALLSVRSRDSIYVVTEPGVKVLEGIRQVEMAGEDFDLNQVLEKLFKLGVYSLFVEGGASTYASFLKQRLADRLFVFIAPKILGKGLSWSEGLNSTSLASVPHLERLRVETFSPDILLTGRPCFLEY